MDCIQKFLSPYTGDNIGLEVGVAYAASSQ